MPIHLCVADRRPFAAGHVFGPSGAYERITGTVRFRIDPTLAPVSGVVDIECAPRDKDGLVSFSAPFVILKPVDMARSNGRILYEVNNRGDKHLLRILNNAPLNIDKTYVNDPLTHEHAGNGFLMRMGYVVVWSGWQGDLLPVDDKLTLDLPHLRDEEKITGLVRSEIITDLPDTFVMPISGTDFLKSYPVAVGAESEATLSARELGTDQRMLVARDKWAFASLTSDNRPVPSRTHLYVKDGYRPGWLYEIIYRAACPRPMGLGFVGVRNLLSFLQYDQFDTQGNANPLWNGARQIEKAYVWGYSQCARFIREFLYRGYNVDEQGRQVFQAAHAHVPGGGRVVLNYRFAQPGRHPRQHQDTLYKTDDFPFGNAVSKDPFSPAQDGILKRPEADPVLITTQGSTEYWERRASLVHTDGHGNHVADHPRARNYLLRSAPHDPVPYVEPIDEFCAYPRNLLQTSATLRALLVALDQWATRGISPPDSSVPKLEDGTGARASQALEAFPKITGLVKPRSENRHFVTDYGEQIEPPRVDHDREYVQIVPCLDADGNELAGLPTPCSLVPVATYVGWNLRTHSKIPSVIPGCMGSQHPLPRTRAEAERMGDPRTSIAERYRRPEDYVAQIQAAAELLVAQRLLLAEDAERYIADAREVALSLTAILPASMRAKAQT